MEADERIGFVVHPLTYVVPNEENENEWRTK